MIRKLVAAFVMILFAASLHSTALAFEPGDVFRETGVGQAPSNWDQRDSFSKTFARQAARMDALRNLAEIVSIIHIESTTTLVNDLEVVSDYVKSTLSQDDKAFKLLEKNARVVDVKFLDNGKCQVTMELTIPADWTND